MNQNPIRLQKYLNQLGLYSRRQTEQWIKEGRITVNGNVAKLGQKVTPGEDTVIVNGENVSMETAPPRVYWLLNKPDQILTSTVDSFNRPTIYDLPKLRKVPFKLDPVGRLDFRTEGLLLLTNDGYLLQKLTHPSYQVPRIYQVLVTRHLKEDQVRQFRKGIQLEDGPSGPIDIDYMSGVSLGGSSGAWYLVTVKEGRNRFVRRLFESIDNKVIRLMRLGFGPIRLPDDLPPGEYRQLTSEQIQSLKDYVNIRPARKKNESRDS